MLSHLKFAFWRVIQLIKVSFLYYKNLHFLWLDILLKSRYLFKNPYRIAKSCGEIYGETPLTTIDHIAKECRILSKDTFFDLGCGTGRSLMWLSSFIKCECYGIDRLPTFISRAQNVTLLSHLKNLHFYNKDILDIDLSKATVIYFYGTSFPDSMIDQLIKKFETLEKGTKIISITNPLESEALSLKKTFKAKFPWGKADVYYYLINKDSI